MTRPNVTLSSYQDVGNFVGSVLSPLLANIYLHELDKYMESNYVQLHEEERRKRRRQGKGNYLYVRYADDWVVLYADDWVVLCNGSKADALAMKEELGGILS